MTTVLDSGTSSPNASGKAKAPRPAQLPAKRICHEPSARQKTRADLTAQIPITSRTALAPPPQSNQTHQPIKRLRHEPSTRGKETADATPPFPTTPVTAPTASQRSESAQQPKDLSPTADVLSLSSTDGKDSSTVSSLNHETAVLQDMLFPAQLRAALSLNDRVSISASRQFLSHFREEAGQTGDAVENLLLDQLVLTHYKIGELHLKAAGTSNVEIEHAYNSAAARLLACVCQLVSTLTAFRTSKKVATQAAPLKTRKSTLVGDAKKRARRS